MLDIADKVDGNNVEDEQYNSVKNNELDAVNSTGQTPVTDTGAADSNVQQLSIAMAIHAAGGYFYVDSGIVNAYVLGVQTISGTAMRAPNVYFNGMICRFVAGNTNTGVSTVNVATLGLKTIKKDQWTTSLAAGDITAGKIYDIIYSTSTGFFELSEAANILLPLSAVQGGTAQTTYAQGDTLYASAVDTIAKLTKGTAGQIYSMNAAGTLPEWQSRINFVDTNVVNNVAAPATFTNLDLSAVVGAYAVSVTCRITAVGGALDFYARTDGETTDVGNTVASVAGGGKNGVSCATGLIGYIECKTSSSGIIEVKKGPTGTNYSLDVIGYIK